MTKPNLLIIGAGLAGLSAAQHAARSGYEVTVLEHSEQPGGVCTAWERAGFTFDGCIQWLMGGKPGSALHALYEDVGIVPAVRLLPVDVLKRFIDEETGGTLDVTADLQSLAASVDALSPADSALMREIVDGATGFEGYERPVDKPDELRGPLDVLQTLWRSRRHARMFGRFDMPVAELVAMAQHPLVKSFFLRSFLPEIPAYYLLTLLAQLHDGQLYVPEGGSYRLSSAVAARAIELGAKIQYDADVQEILVERDQAVGVRLADGTILRADRVLSTAPAHTTILRMLGGKYTDREAKDRLERWPIYRPLSVVSFGVRGTLPLGTPPIFTIRLSEPLSKAHCVVDHVTVRTSSHDPTLAPESSCVVQVQMEADFDFWTELHHAPKRYAQAKNELVKDALGVLDRHLPFVRDNVGLVDVATPYTFWRFARSYRGAYGGFLPTIETLKGHIPKKLPGLAGFYMAGQWVEPGGGVPTALLSGRQAVELLCHDDKRAFLSSE